ncbi:hypothetical protein CSKR_100944 [Clonorchis sinensis]|uniref:Uncharacterized protein n=1 Tax=Clonorchis sinensis TaxID=79923 RepID=A0A419Q4K1_CLOSI|nr:hypothetical protein CSKR_100944 [Clonorchis sinensis]
MGFYLETPPQMIAAAAIYTGAFYLTTRFARQQHITQRKFRTMNEPSSEFTVTRSVVFENFVFHTSLEKTSANDGTYGPPTRGEKQVARNISDFRDTGFDFPSQQWKKVITLDIGAFCLCFICHRICGRLDFSHKTLHNNGAVATTLMRVATALFICSAFVVYSILTNVLSVKSTNETVITLGGYVAWEGTDVMWRPELENKESSDFKELSSSLCADLEEQFRQTVSLEDVKMECEISSISSQNSFVVTTLKFADWLNLTSGSLRAIFVPHQSGSYAHYKTISLFRAAIKCNTGVGKEAVPLRHSGKVDRRSCNLDQIWSPWAQLSVQRSNQPTSKTSGFVPRKLSFAAANQPFKEVDIVGYECFVPSPHYYRKQSHLRNKNSVKIGKRLQATRDRWVAHRRTSKETTKTYIGEAVIPGASHYITT